MSCDCCSCMNSIIGGLSLKGFNAQLTNGSADLIGLNDKIMFNVVNVPNPNITLNNGDITINRIGTYLVNWQVATDGTDGSATVTTAVDGVAMSTNLTQGVCVGSTIVVVTSVPKVISVTNTVGILQLATSPVQANISILGQ